MDQYNMSSEWRDPATGRLFFGGLNGVTHFDPAAVRKSFTPPKVLFSKIVRMSEDAIIIFPAQQRLPADAPPLRPATATSNSTWHRATRRWPSKPSSCTTSMASIR